MTVARDAEANLLVPDRCSKFRFKSLIGEDAGARLIEIAGAEGVKYEDGVIEKLLTVSEGDMRRAVTYLQSSWNLTAAAGSVQKRSKTNRIVDSDDSDEEMTDASAATSSIVTVCTVEEVAGVIPSTVIENLAAALQPQKGRGTVYEALSKQVTDLTADGWSCNQVLSQLYDVIVADETLDLRKKMRCLSVFSELDKRLVDGADEHLAALDLSLRLAAVLGERK
jgi:replication factor C subunit 2/4